jgi:hypothetical protein
MVIQDLMPRGGDIVYVAGVRHRWLLGRWGEGTVAEASQRPATGLG